ncbi:predicted protein [Sclerotinia sclerotiorum 1980 UF-70]|uniref:Uncharacterized protein n=1 Tax=Sclerotinia sclerotiorum (strain ATCC 18683 / 1980 / Ss-1) TaxID=665079 RepID=A7F5G8_SCLS1|nr:predicted protein [Sclerotinia sclerotiorum 1980 UF-70]EDN97989.1 predicted protein [Sclerotinia sclerotiorum 1980 UF-70]
MTKDKLSLGGQSSLSSASSFPYSSSSTFVLRLREEEANHGFDMQFSDIIDEDIRNKVITLLPFYPSYPLLYLVYVLVRSDRMLNKAQDFLENTDRDRAQYLPIAFMTDLEDIKDAEMRDKVEKIRTIISFVTVWWAYYALKVCDGSLNCATMLLLENIIDTSKDPVTQVASNTTTPVSSPMSSRSSVNVLLGRLMDSQSDSDHLVSDRTTPSPNSGNSSFQNKPSSPEVLSQTPDCPFINISDDEEGSTEETATMSSSPVSNRRVVSIDKGKGVDRSDPEDYNSDIDMSGVPPFKEKFQAKKRYEKQTSNCKFCGKELGNWLEQAGHEKSCRVKARQVCVKYFESEDSPTQEQLQKVKRMQQLLPHLSVNQCIESLGLCDDNVEDAIGLEMEASASGEEEDDRGTCSQQISPTKRKMGNLLEERVTKRSRIQVNDKEASLEPATQWIKYEPPFIG